jgi:hypothetical protein
MLFRHWHTACKPKVHSTSGLKMTYALRLLSALACAGLLACGDEESTGPSGPDTAACGIIDCSAGPDDDYSVEFEDEGGFGKADADDVLGALSVATRDGLLDSDDVIALFEACGNRVNPKEMAIIRDAIVSEDFEVEDKAVELAHLIARVHGLFQIEADHILTGASYGGTEVPEAVKAVIAQARLNGAIAYDVNERNDDDELIWTPYPATTEATDNMAFDYTEITPAKLTADLEDTEVEYNAIVGTETAELPDGRTYKQARYEQRKGGTGTIASHYDEVYHPDIYARGRQGQKWANNFAILADGAIHCLPASRRSIKGDLILTNPHLSRGTHMLFNGHLDVREGKVVGIEMSGRLSKRAAKGKAIFIDPIAVLAAWGFEIADGVSVRYGNTRHGVPVRDVEAGIIREDIVEDTDTQDME